MAKMVKSTLLAVSALLLVSAAYASLEEVCRKAPDPLFCANLLQASEIEFESNDPAKMHAAASKAAAEKVDALRALMMGPVGKGAKGNATRDAVQGCLVNADRASLTPTKTKAAAPTNPTAARREAMGMAAIAAQEMVRCQNALKRNEEATKAAGGADAEVTAQGLKAAHEAELAFNVVKALL